MSFLQLMLQMSDIVSHLHSIGPKCFGSIQARAIAPEICNESLGSYLLQHVSLVCDICVDK